MTETDWLRLERYSNLILTTIKEGKKNTHVWTFKMVQHQTQKRHS